MNGELQFTSLNRNWEQSEVSNMVKAKNQFATIPPVWTSSLFLSSNHTG